MMQTRQGLLAQKLAEHKSRVEHAENHAFLAKVLNVDAQALQWQVNEEQPVYSLSRKMLLCMPLYAGDAHLKPACEMVRHLLALSSNGSDEMKVCIGLPHAPRWTEWFNVKMENLLEYMVRVYNAGGYPDFIINQNGLVFLIESNEDDLMVFRVQLISDK